MGLHLGSLENSPLYMQTTTVQQSIAQTDSDPFSPGNGKGHVPDAMAAGLDLCLAKGKPLFRNQQGVIQLISKRIAKQRKALQAFFAILIPKE